MGNATVTFDGYHKWLGIPPKDQPPHHYRLLGLDLFEADRDVISNAADQRMMLVRSFQNGENGFFSQRMLNELATAKLCLLNPERKAEYDRQLQRSPNLPESPSQRMPSRPGSMPQVNSTIETAPKIPVTRQRQKKASSTIFVGTIASMVGIAVLAGVAFVLWPGKHSPPPASKTTSPIASGHSGIESTLPTPSPKSGMPAPGPAPLSNPHSIPTLAATPLRLHAVPPQRLTGNVALRLKIRAEDESGSKGRLRFALAADAPPGMTIDAESGELHWLPSKEQKDQRYMIQVVADDGTRKAKTTFEVAVAAGDESAAAVEKRRGLRIKPVPEQTAEVGSRVQVKLEMDPESQPRSPVKYSLQIGPKGAAVDTTSGTFTWQPDAYCAGQTFEAKVRVSAEDGENADVTFAIEVAQLTADRGNEGSDDGGGDAERRTPVPPEADQKKALGVIHQLFRELFDKARSSAVDRKILAEKLLSVGEESTDDLVGRYTLLREAADQARSAGDIELFMKATHILASHFAVDEANLNQEGLLELAKNPLRSEDLARSLTRGLLEVVEIRIQREQWSEASLLLKAAVTSSAKSRDAELRKQVSQSSREVAILTKAHADRTQALETLTRDKDNAEANRMAGIYEGFVKGNWTAALPYLAKGDDESLATVAIKELKMPGTVDIRKEIADYWATVAGGKRGGVALKRLLEGSPSAADRAREHALKCYELALTDAQGLTKRAIEQQMSELRGANGDRHASATHKTQKAAKIIDNPEGMFTGRWRTWTADGHYGADSRYASAGNGESTATYQFAGLTPGQYAIYATWFEHSNRGTNVPFTINVGGSPTVVMVNQQLAPAADATDGGRNFKMLATVTVKGSTMTVIISNKTNGIVSADAVGIIRK